MKLGIGALSIPVILYVGVCLLLYARQRTFLYYPTPESRSNRAELIHLESAGEKLNIQRANPNQSQAILYFGGNAEDVAQSIPSLSRLLPRHTIYFVHYRGYGGSTGSPSEKGLYEDALNLYDHVQGNHQGISAIGRSLGSGVAIHLASNRMLEKLVVVTPYDSIEALAKKSLPLFPVSLLLKDKYRSLDLAPGIKTPTMVVIAGRDEVIPRSSTDRLVAAFDPAWVVTRVFEGTTHNTIGGDSEYLSQLRVFFNH
jgi:hypothetical protein